MRILLFIHVGYLVAWDDYGVAFGWGAPKAPPKPGAPKFRFYRERPFPWWVQPQHIRHRMMVASVKRRAKRNG